MLPTPLYAPDGMTSIGRHTERFDDGLVHNHHWAVTAEEAYPRTSQGSVIRGHHGQPVAAAEAARFRGRRETPDDRHDDGLVHNHHWAVSAE